MMISNSKPFIKIRCSFLLNSLAEGIGCFKCASENGSNPACDDPFHNNYTDNFYERPCMGGRKNRNGLFPASSCIKMTGYYSECNFSWWHNWILHNEFKNSVYCFAESSLYSLLHMSNSILNTPISGMKFSWDYPLQVTPPKSAFAECTE